VRDTPFRSTSYRTCAGDPAWPGGDRARPR